MTAFETQPLTWLRKANKLIKNQHFFKKVCLRFPRIATFKQFKGSALCGN